MVINFTANAMCCVAIFSSTSNCPEFRSKMGEVGIYSIALAYL